VVDVVVIAEGLLEGDRGEPLGGDAPLDEGQTGSQGGQPVHPVGDLRTTQDPGECHGEVIAVLVDQVVRVPLEVLPQLLHYLMHTLNVQECMAQQHRLLVVEVLTELSS